MSNLLQRLLLFFVGVPAIFAVVWLLPGAHHAATVALVLAFCAGSGLELGRLFVQKGIRVRPALSGALAVAVPLLFYASTFAGPASFGSAGLVGLGLALLAVLVLLPFGLARKEALAEALARAAAYGFILVYPGLLSGFVVLIAAEPPRATEAILAFALATFGNDSLAWLVGSTLGKRRGLVAVSPNKSLAGFVGGFAGSLGGLFLARLAFPASFPAPLPALIPMALAVGAATILGDLFESALKRSAGAKDSGSVVPGRGGFLDSFDSLLFAAPLFYAFALALGLFR